MREYVENGTVDRVRAVEPRGPRLPGGVRRARPWSTVTSRRGRRHVRGRRPRRVHRRRRRRRAARRPVRVQRRQHRRLRLLSRSTPSTGTGSTDREAMRVLLHSSRSDRTGWTSTSSATARSGRRCSRRCARPAGATTPCSCGRTGCWSGTSRPTTWTRPRRRWPPPRSTRGGRPRWRLLRRRSTDRPPDEGFLRARRGLPPGGPARADPRTDAPSSERQARREMTTFAEIAPLLEGQAIEVPSWAYGNSGTRFKVFGTPGTPRSVEEKIADAAHGAPVHRARADRSRCTSRGTWSTTSARCARYAEDHGVALGTINSNTFQDDDYKLGALTHADPKVRQKAIDHHFECIDVMDADRVARPEDLARRRHQLPRPGRHARPAGPARRGPARRSTTGSATTSDWCWSTSSSSRRSTTPTSRTGARRTSRWRRSVSGPWSASTPGTTRRARTSSSSSPSCCGSGSSARSTSTAASTPTTT